MKVKHNRMANFYTDANRIASEFMEDWHNGSRKEAADMILNYIELGQAPIAFAAFLQVSNMLDSDDRELLRRILFDSY